MARKKARTGTKRIRKEIKTLRKNLKKETKRLSKTAKKSAKRDARLQNEMTKLKTEMDKLSKKRSKKQLSEYNLFMRRQLREGKTFARAVRLWKAYRSGKPLVKTKVVKKTVIKRVKSKPKIKVVRRTVVRKVPVTKTVVKRVPVTKTRTVIKRVPVVRTIVREIAAPQAQVNKHESHTEEIERTISNMISNQQGGTDMLSAEEELAIRLLRLYYEEVARLGFKRSLRLHDVLDAYYDLLAKIKSRPRAQSSEHTTTTHTVEHTTEHK